MQIRISDTCQFSNLIVLIYIKLNLIISNRNKIAAKNVYVDLHWTISISSVKKCDK